MASAGAAGATGVGIGIGVSAPSAGELSDGAVMSITGADLGGVEAPDATWTAGARADGDALAVNGIRVVGASDAEGGGAGGAGSSCAATVSEVCGCTGSAGSTAAIS